jgi:hypothetical protein
MKKTKIAYAFVAIALVAILSIASVGATLDINVEVASPSINPGEPQVLTVTTNEPGVGLLVVLQPAMGDAWSGFLAEHPLLEALVASLPPDTQAELYTLIGDKIVSYKLIGPVPEEAFNCTTISMPVIFPDEFTGVNGEPSTNLPGDYKVIFVYISNYECPDQMPDEVNLTAVAQIDEPRMEVPGEVSLIELDFACGRWFVIPEYALGTIAPIISSMAALPLAKRYYKRKHA